MGPIDLPAVLRGYDFKLQSTSNAQ